MTPKSWLFASELQWENRLHHCINQDEIMKNDRRHVSFGVHLMKICTEKVETYKITENREHEKRIFTNDLRWRWNLRQCEEHIETTNFHILFIGNGHHLKKLSRTEDIRQNLEKWIKCAHVTIPSRHVTIAVPRGVNPAWHINAYAAFERQHWVWIFSAKWHICPW